MRLLGAFRIQIWKFLNRDDKRQILSTGVPDNRVADYKVPGLYLMPPASCRNEVTHTAAANFITAQRIYLPFNI